jgi:hypothetical protein
LRGRDLAMTAEMALLVPLCSGRLDKAMRKCAAPRAAVRS